MNKTIHFSVDDVILSFRWISENLPDDIFEMRFFGTLKKWHEVYGMKCTVYIFERCNNFDITQIPDRYYKILTDCKDWIKFGYHGVSSDIIMAGNEEFYKSYEKVKHFICNKIGPESWSDIIRLHCWQASEQQIEFLRTQGIQILLTPNDNKKSYDLTEEEQQSIGLNGFLVKNEIRYIRTNIRFENINMQEMLMQIDKIDNDIVAFTHEWCFEENVNKIEKLFDYFVDKKYEFI